MSSTFREMQEKGPEFRIATAALVNVKIHTGKLRTLVWFDDYGTVPGFGFSCDNNELLTDKEFRANVHARIDDFLNVAYDKWIKRRNS